MTFEQILSELSCELSGARAKGYVSRIASYHRIQGSSGFLAALTEVREALERMHILCQIHTYPADGKRKTFSWTAPVTWNVRSGSLRQITPKERTLIRFDEIPQGVIAHSRAGECEGEADDVKGKFVMATGKPQEVAPLAVKRGAIGVILYPTSQRADAWPDLVQYAGFWPDASQIDHTPLGFSLSRRQADELLAAMREGSVRLAASIDADLGPGSLHLLEGWIPGRNPQAREILLIAHLCHPRPSANDNASGSGLLLEIARTLMSLVEKGRITPERTVRFLWVPEFHGTLPWTEEHQEQVKRFLFVLNLDMVGQSPERLGEPFRVSRVPDSIPSYLNACFEPLLERIADDPRTIAPLGTRRPMHWLLDPASGGSDHVIFSDPVFHIPAVMFGHKDPLHHTHLDDLDMVDPTELKRVGLLSAMLALLPSSLPEEANRLAGWLLRYSLTALTLAFDLVIGSEAAPGEELLNLALHLEEERAISFQALLREAKTAWDGAGQGHTDKRSAPLATSFSHVGSLSPQKGKSVHPPQRITDQARHSTVHSPTPSSSHSQRRSACLWSKSSPAHTGQ